MKIIIPISIHLGRKKPNTQKSKHNFPTFRKSCNRRNGFSFPHQNRTPAMTATMLQKFGEKKLKIPAKKLAMLVNIFLLLLFFYKIRLYLNFSTIITLCQLYAITSKSYFTINLHIRKLHIFKLLYLKEEHVTLKAKTRIAYTTRILIILVIHII